MCVILIYVIFAIILIPFIYQPTTIVDPEVIDWEKLEITNSTSKNIPWGNILEAKYAVEGKNLCFLVK